ncbi:MAG: T9SS type A sorting domain-containing protein [Bacteroidales bacterium]|nr:T9SS type A sorting domain-containing protein [Bacteroidales bacterium]
MKHFLGILLAFCIVSTTVLADGTKQLMPNKNNSGTPEPKGTCYIALGSREGGDGPSRPFARYNSDGTSCTEENRLYIRIDDHTKEQIHLGFGGILYDGYATTISGNSFYYNGKKLTIKYRLRQDADDDKDIDPKVDNGLTESERAGDDPIVFSETDVPTSGTGYITSYPEAYYGPKTLNPNGYNANIISVPRNGLYYLEFYIGCDIGAKGEAKPIDFQYFDVTVVKTENGQSSAVDGRVYSRAWGLNANGSTNEVWSTFYTYSLDHYTSKVYFSGPMPYRFVFCCNSFGSINNKTVEENRQSYPIPDGTTVQYYIPEYKIFLTSPDTKFYGEPSLPNLPKQLSFAGDAMTCEDLIFIMKLATNEDATIELYLNKDEDGNSDKVLIDVLKSSTLEDRGYHYPWKDKKEITEANDNYFYTPNAAGCLRVYKLSLFDQRFTMGGKTFTIGDTTDLDIGVISWSKPLGDKDNPILISSKTELEQLAAAVISGKYEYKIPMTKRIISGTDTSYTDASFTQTITSTDGFAGIHFYLTAPTKNIVLDNTWEGIGTLANPFRGTFRCGKYIPDPEQKSLPDLVGDQDTITITGNKGLFNYCGEGAVIDNVHVKGDTLSLSPTHYQEIDSDKKAFGGICSYAKGTKFKQCSNDIKIEHSNSNFSNSQLYFTGGILGYGENCEIDSCKNTGTITTKKNIYGGTGGIVGGISNTTVNFCYNAGLLNGECYLGGIVGNLFSGTCNISNCRNINAVAATSLAASGILGYNIGSTTISDCENSGSITNGNSIIGMNTNDAIFSISYCLNTGSISNDDDLVFAEDEDSGDPSIIKNCLSLGTNPLYILNDISEETPSISALGSDHFSLDEFGNIILPKSFCCGRIWRNEEAGHLFINTTNFYLAWDGKYDNGECVVGEVTVNYQKNTGVTHFPFFDPENIKYQDHSNGTPDKRGLVVYRIAPIQDTIKDAADPSLYGYSSLPKEYYRTDALNDTEKGIEMKLYWDDRKITVNANVSGSASYANKPCDQTVLNGFVIGNTVHQDAVTRVPDVQYCISYGNKDCLVKSTKQIQVTENGKTSSKYYCVTLKAGATCKSYYPKAETTPASDNCYGIENVSAGGYYGSEAGGHIFPKEQFGNTHIINTWWNGIEAKGVNVLKLTEYSPAVLLPVELYKWNVRNLSKSVLLEWATASEDNNDFFTIERSTDGTTWEYIGKIHGAGTTSMSHSYSYEDIHPATGISYYRLKQTDYNGKYTYSSIKCINRPDNSENAFTAYTNANNNTFIVEGESIAACTIELYDILGHKITNIAFNPISTSKVSIAIEKLPIGTYLIKCCNTSKAVVKNW